MAGSAEEGANAPKEVMPQMMLLSTEMVNPIRWYKPKRWVVERSASWLNWFRKLLIRREKKAENHLALVQLACCIIVCRRKALG
jgi:hypothetical protein